MDVTLDHVATVLKQHKSKKKALAYFNKLNIPLIKRSASKYESDAGQRESTLSSIEDFLIKENVVKEKIYNPSIYDEEIDPLS